MAEDDVGGGDVEAVEGVIVRVCVEWGGEGWGGGERGWAVEVDG